MRLPLLALLGLGACAVAAEPSFQPMLDPQLVVFAADHGIAGPQQGRDQQKRRIARRESMRNNGHKGRTVPEAPNNLCDRRGTDFMAGFSVLKISPTSGASPHDQSSHHRKKRRP